MVYNDADNVMVMHLYATNETKIVIKKGGKPMQTTERTE